MKKRKIEINKIEASIKRNIFCKHIFSIWKLFTDKILLRLTYRYLCWRHPEFKKIEATFENYDLVKNTVVENILLNERRKILKICSEGFGFLAQADKTLWERDDTIEEINFPHNNKEVVL